MKTSYAHTNAIAFIQCVKRCIAYLRNAQATLVHSLDGDLLAVRVVDVVGLARVDNVLQFNVEQKSIHDVLPQAVDFAATLQKFSLILYKENVTQRPFCART